MRHATLITIALLLTCNISLSQIFIKILIIDTLESPLPTFTITVSSPDSIDYETYKRFDSFKSVFQNNVTKETIKTNYPNLVTKLVAFGNAPEVALQLDDSGGAFHVYNAFKIRTDTIRLSHYKVFHNCLPDTVKYWRGWYRKTSNDSVNELKLLKQEHRPDRVITKNCATIYPGNITLVVNSQKSTVALKHVNTTFASAWYHGHKKMSKRKERKWEYARAEGRPYIYFAATIRTQKYVLDGEATLK